VTTSQILFLTGVLCGAFFAALTVAVQVRGPGRWRDVSWKAVAGFLAFGTAFGGLSFLIDSGVAEETLFEAKVPGSGPSTPAVLQWEIPVEHPGALHELGVYPGADHNVETPADVRVQLVDPLGRVLLDEERTLEPRCDGKGWDCTWDSYSAEFVPPVDGEMQLTVTLLTPDVPTVHVRMGDEEKTDGQRIPGY
jgi:hypothetical protein